MSPIGVLIWVMALVYQLAMFRGVDGQSCYHGSVFQVTHPGSFPNDMFMSPSRPIMHSLYYRLVGMIGNVWLDERVVFVVAIGLAALTLAAVDKTAQGFGARRVSERVAILSLMLLGHTILENNAFAVSHHSVNPTYVAAPVSLWLLAQSLGGRSLLVVVPLLLLAVSISVKNAWWPALIALALLGRHRLGWRGQAIAWAVAAALMGAALTGYYAVLRPSDGSHEALFDYILHHVEDREANPWMNPLLGNLLFVALCVAGWMVKGLRAAAAADVRLVAGMGLALWAAGGLYLSYAPEGMKIPYLVVPNPTRALWWTQYVLLIALGVALLKWLQRTVSSAGVAGAWAGLMAVYLLHNTFRAKLAFVVVAATLVMLWRSRSPRRQRGGDVAARDETGWRLSAMSPEGRLRITAAAMCVGALSLYGIGTRHRVPALSFLVRHGIVGDSDAAMWVGVNEYIRERTPASSTVLALVARNALGKEIGLQFGGSLRTRTGRSMPMMGHPTSLYFDYHKLRWRTAQVGHLAELLAAWERHDGLDVSTRLAALGSPDYVVAPVEKSQWVGGVPGFAYTVETVIGEYLIMRKLARISGGDAERSPGDAMDRRVGDTW